MHLHYHSEPILSLGVDEGGDLIGPVGGKIPRDSIVSGEGVPVGNSAVSLLSNTAPLGIAQEAGLSRCTREWFALHLTLTVTDAFFHTIGCDDSHSNPEPYALVEAPALTGGHTMVPGHEEALIALAAFSTIAGTLDDAGGLLAIGGASAGAEFVVTVDGAFNRAECRSPPGIDLDASCLASCDVTMDHSAEDHRVPSCFAKVVHTVVEKDSGVDGRVAGTERAMWSLQDATLAGVHKTGFPAFSASSARKTCTVLSTGCHWVFHFPASCKGGDSGGRVAIGQEKVVTRIAIVIATQTAGLTLIGLSHRDHQMVELVEGDKQPKICPDDHIVTVVVRPHAIALQGERQVYVGTIHQDNAPLFPQNGNGVFIGCDRHCLSNRDFAPGPPLVLHLDLKRWKGVCARAALDKGVGAVALEVKCEAVKGVIVRVTGHMARPTHPLCLSVALLDTVHHTAVFVRTTGSMLALNDATKLANAPLLAETVDIEGLSCLVVEPLVDTATLGDGNALIAAQNVTFVALTALAALRGADDWVEEVTACHRAAAGAHFIVAVCGAVGSAEMVGSPLIDSGTSCLASRGVRGENVTNHILVAFVETIVIDTVLEVQLR